MGCDEESLGCVVLIGLLFPLESYLNVTATVRLRCSQLLCPRCLWHQHEAETGETN